MDKKENRLIFLTLVGNFVSMNELPEDALDEIYPLYEKLAKDNTGFKKWWDEMFRRCKENGK